MRDPSQVLEQAADLQRKGELAAAEGLYLQLIAARPDHFDALQGLALLRYQQGRFIEALSSMGAALRSNPNSPATLLNYAVLLDTLGRREEALAYYDKALALAPNYAEALFNRGIVLRQLRRPAEALASFERVLAIRPDDADAHDQRGSALRDLRRPAEALASYDRALAIRPDDADVLNNRGNALRDLNRIADALASYDRALASRPDHLGALNNRGSALRGLQRPAEALACYDQALAINPQDAAALYNRGNALQDLGRDAEALDSYDQVLAIRPDYVEALNNRGNALRDLKRHAEALASFDRVLAITPNHVEALNNRGSMLQELKRPAEALASFEQALAIRPDYVEALYNRGNALQDLNRAAAALPSYDHALALKPDHAQALYNRGNALRNLHRRAEAVGSFDRALAIKPDYVVAHNNRGLVLRDLGRFAEALESFERALTIEPDFADAHYNRGVVLRNLSRFAEAVASFERALAIEPDHRHAFSEMADAALSLCDWARTETFAGELEARIAQPSSIISPFTFLGYGGELPLQLECARRYVGNQLPSSVVPLSKEAALDHAKIRIAYLSSDFRQHPVACLIAGLFERHDRTRFEIAGISTGPDDRSDMRARLVQAFDRFHDVQSKSDLDAAKLLNDLDIDILVDLNGHTLGSRLGILARRPAPIQVSYLGYAGTMGADFVDYVLADETVLPVDQQPFFSEKVVYLPDCFQVNDSRREIAAATPARGEVGLPDDGFVFCCFNNSYKITPLIFDIWMRLLRTVEGSVLWLSAATEEAMRNLGGQAAARGVDPGRVIFAPRLAHLKDHLARHRLADLFVDTLPFNAHTTASDALWAGLPVLTCRGASFPGRVAASLLSAAGLPELVTSDLREYEALALRLATDASLLRGLRQRLEQDRATCPLFDTDRFRRHIEDAYSTMWELRRRGESPRSFSIEHGR